MTEPIRQAAAIDAWLTEQHHDFIQGLAERLDLDAGLREIMIDDRHSEFIEGLSAKLDLDSGLAAILPAETVSEPPALVVDTPEERSSAEQVSATLTQMPLPTRLRTRAAYAHELGALARYARQLLEPPITDDEALLAKFLARFGKALGPGRSISIYDFSADARVTRSNGFRTSFTFSERWQTYIDRLKVHVPESAGGVDELVAIELDRRISDVIHNPWKLDGNTGAETAAELDELAELLVFLQQERKTDKWADLVARGHAIAAALRKTDFTDARGWEHRTSRRTEHARPSEATDLPEHEQDSGDEAAVNGAWPTMFVQVKFGEVSAKDGDELFGAAWIEGVQDLVAGMAKHARGGRLASVTLNEIAVHLETFEHLLNNFIGIDLSEVDLEGIPLDGVRWSSSSTRWPPDWKQRIERDSVPVEGEDDVFEIKYGTRTGQEALV